VTFVSGYAIWNLDFAFCAELRAFRDAVGMPLGFVTELHGWWHILTAVGVYCYIDLVEELRERHMVEETTVGLKREG